MLLSGRGLLEEVSQAMSSGTFGPLYSALKSLSRVYHQTPHN